MPWTIDGKPPTAAELGLTALAGAVDKFRKTDLKDCAQILKVAIIYEILLHNAKSPWFRDGKLQRGWKVYVEGSSFGVKTDIEYAEKVDEGGKLVAKNRLGLFRPLIKRADKFPHPRQFPKPLTLLITRRGTFLVLRENGMGPVINLTLQRRSDPKGSNKREAFNFKFIYQVHTSVTLRPARYSAKAIAASNLKIANLLWHRLEELQVKALGKKKNR